MFVRMGTFRIRSGTLDALRQRYYADCAPVVRAAEGSVDCYILEPVDADDPVVVCTVWRTEADAVEYEASGSAGYRPPCPSPQSAACCQWAQRKW